MVFRKSDMYVSPRPYAVPPPDIMTTSDLWSILRHPLDFEWRAHGIGFIKTYLEPTKTWRLNLYHNRLRNPGISTMHDHPWALKSIIVCGELRNTRFSRVDEHSMRATPYHEGVINCANFDGLEREPKITYLRAQGEEVYRPGGTYIQRPEEIHSTEAADGTATVIQMSDRTPDGEARVFWPAGTQWGDASRPITAEEILTVAEAARRQLKETPLAR